MRRTRAFTIVELLVVVSLIVLLVALLMPSLGKARSTARLTICESNLRQLGAAVFQYCNANNGDIFPYWRTFNSAGQHVGLPREHFWMYLTAQYHGFDNSVRVCPETDIDPSRQFNYGTGLPQANTAWGTNSVTWGLPTGAGGFLDKYVGSYCWNAWMHSGRWDVDYLGVGRRYDDAANPTSGVAKDFARHWRRIGLVKDTRNTPLFTDGIWVDSWFQNSPTSVSAPPPHLQGVNSAAGRVCVDRHNWSVVHATADGSAIVTRLDELWNLSWNTESVAQPPPTPVPPQ